MKSAEHARAREKTKRHHNTQNRIRPQATRSRRGSCARHQTPPNGRQMSEDERQLRGQRSPSGDARAAQNEERQNQPHRSAQNITRHRGNRCRETERRPSTHRRREGSKGRRHEARHLTRDEDERAMKERAKNGERQQPQSIIELESTRHHGPGSAKTSEDRAASRAARAQRIRGRRQHGARD